MEQLVQADAPALAEFPDFSGQHLGRWNQGHADARGGAGELGRQEALAGDLDFPQLSGAERVPGAGFAANLADRFREEVSLEFGSPFSDTKCQGGRADQVQYVIRQGE